MPDTHNPQPSSLPAPTPPHHAGPAGHPAAPAESAPTAPPPKNRTFQLAATAAVLVIVMCLGAYALAKLAKHRTSARFESVTGAFGWTLGEPLKSSKYNIEETDGYKRISYTAEDDPTIAPFDKMEVRATSQGKIYAICAEMSHKDDFAAKVAALLEHMKDKYGPALTNAVTESYTDNVFGGKEVNVHVVQQWNELAVVYQIESVGQAMNEQTPKKVLKDQFKHL